MIKQTFTGDRGGWYIKLKSQLGTIYDIPLNIGFIYK